MSQKTFLLFISILSVTGLVIGCIIIVLLLQKNPERESILLYQTPDSAVISTQAAQTVIAEITHIAMVASATQTSTPDLPLTETPSATPTYEIIIPSNTPLPTVIVPTHTPIPPTMFVPTFTPYQRSATELNWSGICR